MNKGAAEGRGFAGKDDEDGLGDFLGVMGIAGEAQGGGIDEVHVARDEGGEGRPGIVAGVFGQELRSSSSGIYRMMSAKRESGQRNYF